MRSPRLTLVRGGADDRRGPACTGEIRVLIAAEHPLVRRALGAPLDDSPDIATVGQAATGRTAAELASRVRPDVVVLEIGLPGPDIVAVTKRIAALPHPRVIVLTDLAGRERVFDVLRAGASGILAADTEPAELVRAVRAIARGDAVLAPPVARLVLARFAAQGYEPGFVDAPDDAVAPTD